jgi:antitoxin component of MazEF toxin-antitoxin module
MVYHWYTILRGRHMIKNLVKHGNSWALVIDRPILDLLKIDPEGQLEITTDGQSMTIAPVNKDSRKAVVRAARKKINARYGKAFKKLAE